MAYREACHEAQRSRAEAQAIARDLLLRTHQGADLGALAAARSDEPFGRARGGRVEIPRDLDSPLGDVASLPVDGKPVLRESQYGFHLIRRVA